MKPLYQSAPQPTQVNTLYFGSDHAAWSLKKRLMEEIQDDFKNLRCIDCGPTNDRSCDYPEFAWRVAQSVAENPDSLGILLCGSGIGVSLVANQHPQIRAALAHSISTSQLARQHNDAQVLCMGARLLKADLALDMLKSFIKTPFEGDLPEGIRHIRRLNQMYLLQKDQ